MKVIFLDRDGVINEFPGHGNYVTKVKDFRFIPGSVQAIKALTEAGYTIFVISNQAGVGKGVFTQDKLNRIDRKLHAGIKAGGGKIAKSLYCTHRSDAGCECRKPGIGNIRKALKSVGKTLAAARGAFFIGDAEGDMKAGKAAGCRTIAVLSGKETARGMKSWTVKSDYVAPNLKAAIEIILNENMRHTRNSRSRA